MSRLIFNLGSILDQKIAYVRLVRIVRISEDT